MNIISEFFLQITLYAHCATYLDSICFTFEFSSRSIFTNEFLPIVPLTTIKNFAPSEKNHIKIKLNCIRNNIIFMWIVNETLVDG